MQPSSHSRLTLTQIALALCALLSGCASREGNELQQDSLSLTTAEGDEIVAESVRCIYRQARGGGDRLELQLQYLSEPDRVAFAVYVENPIPSAPFVAAPEDVARFSFEAFTDDAGYSAELEHAEITMELDELPDPSTLRPGDAVHLHGRLQVTDFSLPKVSQNDAAASELHLAAGSVLIDCETQFEQVPVLD